MIIKAEPIGCDICKKMRGNDSNHWLVLLPGSTDINQKFMSIYEWDDQRARMSGSAHACGQEHAAALVERWLSKKTFEVREAVTR